MRTVPAAPWGIRVPRPHPPFAPALPKLRKAINRVSAAAARRRLACLVLVLVSFRAALPGLPLPCAPLVVVSGRAFLRVPVAAAAAVTVGAAGGGVGWCGAAVLRFVCFWGSVTMYNS